MSGIPVLMYHWVNDDLGNHLRLYGVAPGAFASQMRSLSSRGRRAGTLDDLLAHVRGSTPAPDGTIVLTFDDGYRDNVENAGPVLEALGWTATIFVVTDRAGGVNAWDARYGDTPRPILSWDEMRALDGKVFRFEPHSRTHRPLPTLDDAQAADEIGGSKRRLEDELGRASRVFSYPHGEFSRRVEGYVRAAGFEAAVTDLQGLNTAGTDPLRLKRTMITSRDVAATYFIKSSTGYGVAGMWDEGLRRLAGRPPRWERAR
ncbi:MAG TPA: polysaccharide deacetylase family protein [Candidatus Polarisedimenticolaceae bacterium]